MVGEYIKNSGKIKKEFSCRFIDMGTSRTTGEVGKGGIMKPLRYMGVLVRVIFTLMRFRPQVCYMAIAATGPAFYKDTLVALLLRASGANIIYHFHNKGVRTKQKNRIDDLLYSKVFKDAKAILLSPYLYHDVEKYFAENKVFYCPNGVPEIASKASVVKRGKRGITEILFLSNLIASKGILDLLEAVKILKARGLDFHLTVVGGEGDVDRNMLRESLLKLGIEDLVTYVGKKFGAEKKEIFLNADIFAFPTYYHYECFPLVLLEAMQYSLPVVSTFEGGIPEIVDNGETGLLVNQRDIEGIADKLEYLIKNPEIRRSMGEKGNERYENNFTLSTFENRITEILREVAAPVTPSA
ncbi:glycosyltransferase family 4 protein [Salinimicrobium sp. TH3]|nr:glycosyltransferase family 4 protein [Salinimicrobium sp. TH3]